MRILAVLAILGFFCVSVYSCTDENDRRDADTISEEMARDIGEDLEQELERAEDRIEDLRDRIEDRFEDDMSWEDLEEMGREVEETVARGMARIGELLEEIGSRIQEDADVSVVDYRDFRSLLADEIEGMERIGMKGANKGAFGMRVSKLEAEYESEDMDMEIAILDLGTMKGLLAMGFDYIDQEIDEEDRDGFKRTRKFSGYPGFESARYDGRNAEIQGVVIIEERFVVALNIEGRNVDKDIVEDIFDDFPFRRLRRLAQ